MEHNADDLRAAEHLMQVITRLLGELYDLYPSQNPFSAGSVLLTADILMLVDQLGSEKAAKAVRSLAKEIDRGLFDMNPNHQPRTIQ